MDGSNHSAAVDGRASIGAGLLERPSLAGGAVGGANGVGGSPPNNKGDKGGDKDGGFVPDANNVVWLQEMEKGFDKLLESIYPFIKDVPESDQLLSSLKM